LSTSNKDYDDDDELAISGIGNSSLYSLLIIRLLFLCKKIRYGCRGLSNLVPLILFIYVNVLLFYKAEMTSDRIRTFSCIYEQKLRAVISGGVVF